MSDQPPVLDRIVADPKVCEGRPHIRGSEITVNQVMQVLAARQSVAAVLEAFPDLEPEDVEQAIRYAAGRAAELFGE